MNNKLSAKEILELFIITIIKLGNYRAAYEYKTNGNIIIGKIRIEGDYVEIYKLPSNQELERSYYFAYKEQEKFGEVTEDNLPDIFDMMLYDYQIVQMHI